MSLAKWKVSGQMSRAHPSVFLGIEQDLFSHTHTHTKIIDGVAKSSSNLNSPDFSNYVLLEKQCFK